MLKQWLAGVGLVAVLLGSGCVPEESEAAPEPSPSAVSTPAATPAVVTSETLTPTTADPAPTSEPATAAPEAAAEALATLEVKGRAPKTGYDRGQFGQRWADIDRNGCDQRNDVLLRDLTAVTFKPGTRGCVVATGTLADPFTGTAIDFVRGEGTSNAVQIDHVISAPGTP